MARKNISKKLRFEVFKRDNFTCQYCGQAAPDVILHVDHISPVAGGGSNDLLNLLTSCVACNLGKGAKTLDDNSAITKQRAQLAELNERREQLEMMLSWREGLKSIDDDYLSAVEDALSSAIGFGLSETGRGNMRQTIKKFGLSETLEAVDAAVSTYWRHDDTEEGRVVAAEKVIKGIPRVAAYRRAHGDDPSMKELFYTRAIIRNRLSYINEQDALIVLKRALAAGIHIEEMKDWAKQARSWTNWKNEMLEWIAEYEAADDQE